MGTELTTGATRDTNAGDLARELTALGVEVLRMTDLPDDLPVVTGAFREAVARADLVVSSGGLGPTPDDLTREAIAAACDTTPWVDSATEAWLESLFARRGLPIPDANRKQAWLIKGAVALRNEHGSAPGWWVERDDGGVIVALPGPPSEMWPMWRQAVAPRLAALDAGVDRAARTLRLTGVGESALVELVGEDVLRAKNPQVATYARADAVDLRISAVGTAGGPSAAELVDATVSQLMPLIGRHVFAEGDDGWAEALAHVLGERRLATLEIGTGGKLMAMLGGADYVLKGELLNESTAGVSGAADLAAQAGQLRDAVGADVALAVHAAERRGDTRVVVAVATAGQTTIDERTAFLAGAEGGRRAALAACAVLWQRMLDHEMAR